jgi:putative colanic acid biosynthesis acetyltransferase WcaF
MDMEDGRAGATPGRMTLSLFSPLVRSSGYATWQFLPPPDMIDLAGYTTGKFQRGASPLKEAVWWIVRALFFQTPFPWPSSLRVTLLRLFGATIGQGVIIRAGVNITFPWRFTAGDHIWLGDEVLILTLAPVVIESNCCISQRAFLCTGSHDFSSPAFSLKTAPITIRQGSWIAAAAFIAPGVTIGPESMVAAGSVVLADVPPKVIVRGNPAAVAKQLP